MATHGDVELVREAAWQLADEDGEARTVTVHSHVSMPAARPQWVRNRSHPRPVTCASLEGRDRQNGPRDQCQASSTDK